MDLPAASIALASAIFLLLAVLAFRRRRILLSCLTLCTGDLELGATTASVSDGPETEQAEPPEPPAGKTPAGGSLPSPRLFTLQEVESSTGNFTSAVIGKGGFSTVFLARLPDHSFAAVKLHHSSQRLHRAFRSELAVLLRIHHPYIVRLLGFCDEQDDQGALVMEYVPSGSLHDKLHGAGAAVAGVLPWARRTSIANRLAQALDYLHEGCELQIVHGDIKASNVLLDDSLNPKLCDFGCARMGFSGVVRQPAPMTGSPGYVDPHYIRTGVISKKSDVYSFGVLLLELITGAEAFDAATDQLLTAGAAPVLREIGGGVGVDAIVDQRLNGEYDHAEAAALGSLAALCLGENPSVRPSMAEIVRIMWVKVPSSISAVDPDISFCSSL
ncbi:putative receptor-like protein kinase [Apostasia shenzhenica]|uniref:Putative receptor-like protein kinase n=1 Tax=Apostasia shenzhenica TaxID=1088818 RepID=A0A2I0AEN4_9ASPA|nr:putative receptor-like protein kinase [Apostasia shenzhenica]